MQDFARPRPRPPRPALGPDPDRHAGVSNSEQLERLGMATPGADRPGAEAALLAALGATPAGPDAAPAGQLTLAVASPAPGAAGGDGAADAAAVDAAALDAAAVDTGAREGGTAGAKEGPQRVAPDAGTTAARVYQKHRAQLDKGLTGKRTAAQARDLAAFKANWEKNRARYEAVGKTANVPAALVAALHWRESTGDFGTYLHQGDPLGKKARNEPKDIPVFHKWEEAAVHALTMPDKAKVRDDVNLDTNTRDGATLATYSEFYNGLGYDRKKRASPYVYSGTDAYSKGKYVAGGKYSAGTTDRQLGVLVMVDAVGGMDETIKEAPSPGAAAWAKILAGSKVKRGARGAAVTELQARLARAGFACGSDGAFGPTVEGAVKAFQAQAGLDQNGVVGPEVARAIDAAITSAAGAATAGG